MPAAGQVTNELERSVIELLESRTDAIIPLSELRAALDTRLGARAPGPASLLAGIVRRADIFMVLTHDPRFPGSELWPNDVRAQYDSALTGAGLRPETHIALKRDLFEPPTAPPPDAGVLRELQHSVLRLWRVREKQPAAGLDNAVTLFATLRSALGSHANAE